MLSILKTVLISCVLFLQLSSSVVTKRHGPHGLSHLPRHITAPKRLSTTFLPPTSPDENSQHGLLNASSKDNDSSDEDGDDSGQDQDDEGDQENGDEEENPDAEDTENTGDTNDAEDVIDANSDESEGKSDCDSGPEAPPMLTKGHPAATKPVTLGLICSASANTN
jgi:hypothetical protein